MCQCTDGEIAILNSGIMRSKRLHPRGPFTMKDLLSILPFTSTLVVVKCTGKSDLPINLQTTMRGPIDPVALSTSSQKVIIGIQKPM